MYVSAAMLRVSSVELEWPKGQSQKQSRALQIILAKLLSIPGLTLGVSGLPEGVPLICLV